MLFPAFLVGFVFVERRASHPLIPLRYFRRPNFAFPLTNQFFTNFAYMGGFILTPLLLQEQLGYGEAKTGLPVDRPSAELRDHRADRRLHHRRGSGSARTR